MARPAQILLRPYRAADAARVTELFRTSVRELAAADYRPPQLRAWAPDMIDAEAFGKRCQEKATLIAEIDGRVAGFSDLDAGGHVDMLYVHPEFARRGVAWALLQHIEQAALAAGLRRLYTEDSITARAVFEKVDFRVVVPQMVTVRGETMRNYRMEKWLDR